MPESRTRSRSKTRANRPRRSAQGSSRTLIEPPARARPISRGREIPQDVNELNFELPDGRVRLTNLKKLFWPELRATKRDLLQYYLDVSPVLLPHLRDRAMVMKRYPNGAAGEFFFMKRAPMPRPQDIQICSIEHASGHVIGFPVVEDLLSLLWIVNLGCIDLNPWYARCDDIHRPDYLHFDLDPVPGAGFGQVIEAAVLVRDSLQALGIPSYPKTTGSRGIHVYVPIVRGPLQRQVWGFAKRLAKLLESRHPELITAEYRVMNRPQGHVLVDYNQNAWGRTLASVYSVRPTPRATVSAPVRWEEVEKGIRIEDFRIDNVPDRIRKTGDLWKPLIEDVERVDLERILK
ncbi:MAG: non-homologous end-joining DNA ligase [Terriglobia bacterium]